MFKISSAVSLALHASGILAEAGQPVTTHEIAERLGVSEAHLSKVFQRLHRAGLVKGTRGPGGGFCLATPPERITLRQVCEAIEGPYDETSCPLHVPACKGEGFLSDELRKIMGQLLRFLDGTRLSTWSIPLPPAHGCCRPRKKRRRKES